jgi:hypothetical protein
MDRGAAGPVAQLAEHAIDDREIVGSIPTPSTIFEWASPTGKAPGFQPGTTWVRIPPPAPFGIAGEGLTDGICLELSALVFSLASSQRCVLRVQRRLQKAQALRHSFQCFVRSCASSPRIAQLRSISPWHARW